MVSGVVSAQPFKTTVFSVRSLCKNHTDLDVITALTWQLILACPIHLLPPVFDLTNVTKMKILFCRHRSKMVPWGEIVSSGFPPKKFCYLAITHASTFLQTNRFFSGCPKSLHILLSCFPVQRPMKTFLKSRRGSFPSGFSSFFPSAELH